MKKIIFPIFIIFFLFSAPVFPKSIKNLNLRPIQPRWSPQMALNVCQEQRRELITELDGSQSQTPPEDYVECQDDLKQITLKLDRCWAKITSTERTSRENSRPGSSAGSPPGEGQTQEDPCSEESLSRQSPELQEELHRLCAMMDSMTARDRCSDLMIRPSERGIS